MIQSVQQAARAAGDAAQALRNIGLQQRPGGNSGENKIVQCPKEFGATISAEDQNSRPDFSFAFRQWLCFADAAYSGDLNYVEEHSDTPVTYMGSPEGQTSKPRSCKPCVILAGILKNRPLRTLRGVPESNGTEVWRQLHAQCVPRTRVRTMTMPILNASMGFPTFSKEKTLLEQVQMLERLGDEYRKAFGSDIFDDILLNKQLPCPVQQHIQLVPPTKKSKIAWWPMKDGPDHGRVTRS